MNFVLRLRLLYCANAIRRIYATKWGATFLQACYGPRVGRKAAAAILRNFELQKRSAAGSSSDPMGCEKNMNRRDLVLSILAASQGRAFTPVQIQKAVFLVSTNIPQAVTAGVGFNFVPYDYGPFDKDVYLEAVNLSVAGDAIVAPSAQGRWNTYAASAQGLQRGQALLAGMSSPHGNYVSEVARWVLDQSFGSLVKSIYSAYPSMKQNSIFQG